MENWKAIEGFKGYEVSDCGNVRSYWSRRSGLVGDSHPVAQTSVPGKKYRRVALQMGGKSHMRAVHRLVLEAFVGPCPEGMECLHADDDAANNFLNNLRWGTKLENMQEKMANERVPKGEDHSWAILTNVEVQEIKRRLASPEAKHGIGRKLAREFGVHPNTIYQIKDGLTWSHI